MRYMGRRTMIGATTAISVTRPQARAAGEPIRIGWMQALTGPSSAAGIGFHRGSVLATEAINAAGGVNGRLVELVVRDTQGDPTKAVNAAQELISRERVHAIAGPGNSGETLAVTPLVARARLPHLHAGSIDTLIDPKRYPNAFRFGVSNSQWTAASSDFALNRLELKQVAVLGDSTGYGTSAAAASADDLAQRGATIVSKSLLDPNQVDVAAELLRARSAGSQALLVWSSSTGLLARLLNTRGDMGWTVPVIGHPTLGSGEVGHLLSRSANWDKVYPGGFLKCSFDSTGKLPPQQAEFAARLRGKVDLEHSLLWLVGWGWDAITLVASAVKSTGSSAPEAIIGNWNSLRDYPGMLASYSCTPDNHNGFPNGEVVMTIANAFQEGAFRVAEGY
jgi:branched-chain amino acid transport system substrate-binding protein